MLPPPRYAYGQNENKNDENTDTGQNKNFRKLICYAFCLKLKYKRNMPQILSCRVWKFVR